MLVALLSDIHSNSAAFAAVMIDAHRAGAREYWFLGDLFGYCHRPVHVVDVLNGEVGFTHRLLGNHDAALLGLICEDGMTTPARRALHLNRVVLLGNQRGAAVAATMIGLPWYENVTDGVWLAHGMLVPAEDRRKRKDCLKKYVDDRRSTVSQLSHLRDTGLLSKVRLLIVGHSHHQMAWRVVGGEKEASAWGQLLPGFGLRMNNETSQNRWQPAREGPIGTRGNTEEVRVDRVLANQASGLVILNPGSVGLPRDGARAGEGRTWAKYALLDSSSPGYSVRFCRVSYRSKEFVKELREAGYPPEVADWLEHEA